MGRVLVKAPQPTAAQSAGNILEQLLPMPKTRTGGFLGGALGTIGFMDALADAGASEQDLISGINTGAQRAYGLLSGGGRAGDIASSGARGAAQTIADRRAPQQSAHVDARDKFERDRAAAEAAGNKVLNFNNDVARIERNMERNDAAKRGLGFDPSASWTFDTDTGSRYASQLGRVGNYNPSTGRFHTPADPATGYGGGFATDMFSSNYPQTSAYQSAVASIPAPPTNNDDDMNSMAEDSMGGNIDVSHSGRGEAELVDDPAGVMGAGTGNTPFDVKELEGVTMPGDYKVENGEPMDVAFRLLKFRTWENE